jgi:hypothetical protein
MSDFQFLSFRTFEAVKARIDAKFGFAGKSFPREENISSLPFISKLGDSRN